jgi:hypothetical protein
VNKKIKQSEDKNMSMFDNYQNNNPHTCYPPQPGFTHLAPIRPNKPYEEYNVKGELIGYYWYYGDVVNLEYNIDGEVTDVESGTYIRANEWLETKRCKVTLLDFRHEVVASKVFPGSSQITFTIDSALSKSLLRGVYYCRLAVIDTDDEETILSQTDESTLYVK